MSAQTAIPVQEDLASSRALATALRVAITAAQLALIALVIRAFQLENRWLFDSLLLALVGFVAQALLPARWRMACFALVSVGSVLLLFAADGLWVLGAGALLLGVSVLPVRFSWRLGLALALVIGFMLVRQQVVSLHLPGYLWPIMGGMFMFRAVLYFYTVRHEGPPKDHWGTVAYFFMLPNAAFPFFPIVDYKTFLRQHFDAPESALYARGIGWMTRGVIHLLLYRVVYHYIVLDPSTLRTLGDVVQYCLQTYLLYLRVSGQFHLVVGLLHLFGFRLPETHHLYYLSSSFTELWRRINIYWKDFMQKVVYQPTFFRLRKYGNDRAIVLSTVVVMVITYLLHGWQKFWIVAGSPFNAGDAMFWGILGLLVVVAAYRDVKGGARRAVRRKGYDFRRALGTTGVFLTIALLYTVWSSESPRAVYEVLAVGRNVDTRGVLLLTGLVGGLLLVGGWDWGATDIRDLKLKPLPMGATLRHAAMHASVLGALLLVAQPAVKDSLGFTVSGVVSQLASSRLNSLEHGLLTRSYYEAVNTPTGAASQSWEVQEERPTDWVIIDSTSAWGFRRDYLATELVPNQAVLFKGHMFRTNSHGMRDREYSLVKPERTYRVAVLGASPVMAPGVAEDSAFDAVLERHLAELGAPRGLRIEVLNFGVAAYSLVQERLQLEQKVMAFQPDLVLFTSMPPDHFTSGLHFLTLLRRGIPIPDSAVAAALADVGSGADATMQATQRALQPLLDGLLTRSVTESDSILRDHGVKAAMLLIRLPEDETSDHQPAADAAQRLGWPVIDLRQIYGTHPEQEFRIADYDHHWNEAGHRLMASTLEEGLRQHAAALGFPLLWTAPEAPADARPRAVTP